MENGGLDFRVDGYLFEKNVSRDEVIQYIRSFKDRDVRDRLRDRFKFSTNIRNLPNRAFWLALKGIPSTDARAKFYILQTNKMSVKEREELREGMSIVRRAGGVVSREFMREVGRLRGETRLPE